MAKNPLLVVRKIGGVQVRFVVEDIDKDGDLDVAVEVGGIVLASVELSKIAEDAREEIKRVVERFRKPKAKGAKGGGK